MNDFIVTKESNEDDEAWLYGDVKDLDILKQSEDDSAILNGKVKDSFETSENPYIIGDSDIPPDNDSNTITGVKETNVTKSDINYNLDNDLDIIKETVVLIATENGIEITNNEDSIENTIDENGDKDDEEDDEEDDVQVTIRDIKATPSQYNYGFKGMPFNKSLAHLGGNLNKVGSLDIDEIGSYNNVPIIDVNIEDLEERPWRKPGADITDYFNYGFNEESWKVYCERQKLLRNQNSVNLLQGIPILSSNDHLKQPYFLPPASPGGELRPHDLHGLEEGSKENMAPKANTSLEDASRSIYPPNAPLTLPHPQLVGASLYHPHIPPSNFDPTVPPPNIPPISGAPMGLPLPGGLPNIPPPGYLPPTFLADGRYALPPLAGGALPPHNPYLPHPLGLGPPPSYHGLTSSRAGPAPPYYYDPQGQLRDRDRVPYNGDRKRGRYSRSRSRSEERSHPRPSYHVTRGSGGSRRYHDDGYHPRSSRQYPYHGRGRDREGRTPEGEDRRRGEGDPTPKRGSPALGPDGTVKDEEEETAGYDEGSIGGGNGDSGDDRGRPPIDRGGDGKGRSDDNPINEEGQENDYKDSSAKGDRKIYQGKKGHDYGDDGYQHRVEEDRKYGTQYSSSYKRTGHIKVGNGPHQDEPYDRNLQAHHFTNPSRHMAVADHIEKEQNYYDQGYKPKDSSVRYHSSTTTNRYHNDWPSSSSRPHHHKDSRYYDKKESSGRYHRRNEDSSSGRRHRSKHSSHSRRKRRSSRSHSSKYSSRRHKSRKESEHQNRKAYSPERANDSGEEEYIEGVPKTLPKFVPAYQDSVGEDKREILSGDKKKHKRSSPASARSSYTSRQRSSSSSKYSTNSYSSATSSKRLKKNKKNSMEDESKGGKKKNVTKSDPQGEVFKNPEESKLSKARTSRSKSRSGNSAEKRIDHQRSSRQGEERKRRDKR